ncbi:MAG: DUF805 domain-containing protein [Pseudomonadota bacterium]
MFDFLFNPSGRISRKGYAIGFFLPYFVLAMLPGFFLVQTGVMSIIMTIIGLFYFWPALIAVPFKRLHDLGYTGWLHILVIVAIGVLMIFAFSGMFMEIIQDPEGDTATLLAQEGLSGWQMTAVFWGQVLTSAPQRIAFALATILQYGEMIAFLALAGKAGENKYGQDPLVDGMGFAD